MGCTGAKQISQLDKTAIKARGSMYFGQTDDGRDPTQPREIPHGLLPDERHMQLHSELEQVIKAGDLPGILKMLTIFSQENLKIVPPVGSSSTIEQIEASLASINIEEVKCPHCNALNLCVTHPAQCVCGKCNQRFEHPLLADIKLGLSRKAVSMKETSERIDYILGGRLDEARKEYEKKKLQRESM